MSDDLIPFGKYKGQPIEVLDSDPRYVEWAIAQAWVKERFAEFYKKLANNLCDPQDSPDHNAMQVKFLDADYAAKVAIACSKMIRERYEITVPDIAARAMEIAAEMVYKLAAALASPLKEEKYQREHLRSARVLVESNRVSVWMFDQWQENYRYQQGGEWENKEQWSEVSAFSIHDNRIESPVVSDRIFEGGCDVEYWVTYGFYPQSEARLRVELKPSVSDDYPTVLRAMRRQAENVLLVGQYSGSGATKEQFVATFQSQKAATPPDSYRYGDRDNIKVAFCDDVDAVELKRVFVETKDFMALVGRKIKSLASDKGIEIGDCFRKPCP